MAHTADMLLLSARVETFERPHQLAKRRASSQSNRRRNGSTVEWPHAKPTPEELARAGFYYKPSQDSNDNCQCFVCGVKLDGWEAEDDPAEEHFQHSKQCPWAKCISVAPKVGKEELRDPMSEEMVAARTETFALGDGWVHEKKKGWKCKTKKMVDAGWCYDPAQDVEDAVSCFYCGLGLDGWEPKDDPLEEHRRRKPDCPFFSLIATHSSAVGSKAKGKGKGKAKGPGRGSVASTASSRVSVQSVMSTFSDPPSLADIGDDLPAADDSVLTTATNASSATAKGGKKKTTRAKGTAKGGKGKKQSAVPPDEMEVQYPDLSQAMHDDPMDTDELPVAPAPKPTRKGKATRASQQPIDSSVVEISSLDHVSPKATRGRKPKVQQQPMQKTPEPEDYNKRNSEASAQLLDELEQSLAEPDFEATPQPVKPKRGTKRTSDGLRKDQDSGAVEIEAPVKKPTKGGKTKAAAASQLEEAPEALLFSPNTSITEYPWVTGQFPHSESEADQPKKGAKGKKAAPKKTKGKKTSSARSSKATVVFVDPEPIEDEDEDLARDEMEIEAELERIAAEAKAAEEAVLAKVATVEQDREEEYEPSPTHKPVQRPENLEVAEDSPASPHKDVTSIANATPSPTGSDKENMPSVLQLSAKPQATIYTSPTKTTRIPLATGTPNVSPRKMAAMTPSKHISHLTSANPWHSAELESILLASPQATPGTLGQRLASVAGNLTTVEKQMTVEEWVQYLAGQEEEALRSKCEQRVSVFEREGMRAMQSLEGIASL